MFLDDDEIAKLTGKKAKSKQIDELRKQGIAFRVNSTGHPVVTRAAVEGIKEAPQKQAWVPRVLRAA